MFLEILDRYERSDWFDKMWGRKLQTLLHTQVTIQRKAGFFKVLENFPLNFCCSQIMSYFCQNKLGVTNFVSEIKRVENYPDFKQLAQVIQQGFIVKNIEGESTEAELGLMHK